MYNPPVSLAYPASSGPPVREKPLDIRQLFRFLISNSLLIFSITALFVALAVVYVTVTSPTYVSSAQLMLETQKATGADAQRTLAEESLVEGQMEIMKSGGVLTAVVENMNLSSDAEFQLDHLPIADTVRSMLSDPAKRSETPGTTETSPEDAQANYTIATLRSRLWIRRVGQSTVIEISAASSDPRKAALIANAVSEQYIAQNVKMKSQAAFQSSEWLAQRVADLQEAVFSADRAVMKFQSSGDPGSQFKLTELKSVAETQHRLYETYLQSWSEAKQRISYPVSDATFVSRATIPVAKSQPKSMLLVAFALILGLGAGVVVAIARHFGNRLITSAHRITTEIGVPCIGEVAQANRGRAKRMASPAELLQTGEAGKPGTREWFDRDMRDLRATLGGLRRSRKANLIGLVGTEAKAGATTVAYNLARLAAASGSKTLLIDASATNPTLSQTFGEGRAVGLMDVLNDSRTYTDFVSRIDRRFTILPIGTFREVTPGERIGSERIAFSFADLKERFDLILIDLPSMPGSSDAKSIAPYLDGSLIVALYGRSSFDTLAQIVDALRDVGADILGVVLNGSPQRKN
ncbi:GumC family protein [Pararhizobium sp. DWP3-4]|uniref:GumC family protein n=1 Tax=unclassified Pararhizobium TaxID=2643050 RepID=UPI003CECBE32